MSKKRGKKGRVSVSVGKRVFLILVGVILAVVLLFLLLFKTENIIVTGNDRYSQQQIKDICINEEGYNNTILYYLFHQKIETPDVPLLEYIDTVYVDRNTLQFRAHEKLTIGMFRVGDKVCCIDQDGIVIEILDYEGSEALGLPLISGLGSKGTVGEKIEMQDEAILNALSALESSFKRYGITPDHIDMETEEEEAAVSNYILTFGNVKVYMGPDKNLEEKMRRAAAILPQIADLSGVLHLENLDEETENIIFDTLGNQ